jgi:hypothetical protein
MFEQSFRRISEMEKHIRDRWTEYKELATAREHYSAILRVAEIYSCLPRMPISWRSAVAQT